MKKTVAGHDQKVSCKRFKEKKPINRFQIKRSRDSNKHRFVEINRLGSHFPAVIERVAGGTQSDQIRRVVSASGRNLPNMMNVQNEKGATPGDRTTIATFR